MTDYPYVQSWFDYGVRNAPTLGLIYHMAEGGGTVGYLDDKGNPPTRGVSVHAVCEYDGTVVQMLPWSHASGSLNPNDRTTEYGYYGHSDLVAVLGNYWTNPNVATLSMEIEGFRDHGPNPAQVDAAIAWGLDMKQRYPELRGALGHHDQSPKPCPGTTPAMQAIFEGVGGHGLWQPQETVVADIPVLDPTPKLVDIPIGADILTPDGATKLLDNPLSRTCYSPFASESPGGTGTRTIIWTRAAPAEDLFRAVYGNQVTVRDVPAPDCTAEKKAAVNAALDHVQPAVDAVDVAINEARIR